MKIQVGDIAVEYELDGPEDGPVLMLHHSLATSHLMWDELIIALAQYYRVLSYDGRGHGLSDAPPGPYNWQQLVGDATGLMEVLGIEKAIHTGISMGGMLAQHMAIAAPQRVSALVLVSTTSNMPVETAPVWDQRIADVTAKGMAPQVEDTIKRWFTKDFREDPRNAGIISSISELIAATPVNGYCGWAAAIRDLNLTPHLGNIHTPTLVMVGEDDPGTPPASARVIADSIPGAMLKIFEEASHMLPLQQPDRFLESLIDFIEDQNMDGEARTA